MPITTNTARLRIEPRSVIERFIALSSPKVEGLFYPNLVIIFDVTIRHLVFGLLLDKI